ncbi:hypothetical protein JCM5350_001755 [Sporobolomyces pararoseus]
MSGYPYKAVATLKYRPPPTQGPSISFDKGSTVTVLGAADDDGDWLEGENDQGIKGVFPATFVQRLEEAEEGGERSSEGKDELQEPSSAPVETSQPKDETPAPSDIEQAASSIAKPASSPSPTTSPPAVPEASIHSATSDSPASSAPSKATPPPPAKKPNALAARIAAFNQSQQSPSAPPPAPKPKTASKWTVGTTPSIPPPSTSPPVSASSPPLAAGPSTPLDQAVETDSSGKPKEFSAEDAKESIGRGGGSLKDRIKALQGLQIDQPAPPGRPPKPWKKKSVEEEEGVDVSTPAPTQESETVVKVEEPKHDVEVPEEEEQIPEIPSFEPAEPAIDESAQVKETRTEEKEVVPEKEKQEETEKARPTNSEKPSSIDLLAIAADSTPVVMTPGSASLEVPTDPSPFIPSTDKSPAAPQKEEETVEGEEDSEAAKKQAIAARMAGLGGQKIGAVPIPALPKKAAGPRRNARGAGAKSPASPQPPQPVKPQETEIEQVAVEEKKEKPQETADEDSPLEQLGSKEAETEVVNPDVELGEKQEDVLASMGGASSMLKAEDDDEEENGSNTFDDEDDFETPAPAPPSRPAPPTIRPSEDEQPQFEDPKLESGEKQVEEEEFRRREEPVEAAESNLGEQAIETLPTPTTADPVVDDQVSRTEESSSKPPIPLNRPPVPPSFVRQATDEPPRSEVNAHRFNAEVDNPREASSASSPPPPARPAHAPPFASGHETVSDDPRPVSQAPEEVSPIRSDSQRSPVNIPADLAGFRLPAGGEAQRPPVPRHPAPPGHDKVTTDAEDRIMNETEVVTPPQEAFDESTAAPELTAPSVLDLAEVRDSHPESEDLSRQALPPPGRQEGEATPVPVASPPPTSPQPVEDDDEEEGEDEEEEDPEVARRRAIAARMAKLGGMSMRMGPMIPPVGGLPPPAKKKAKKPKVEEEGEPLNALEAKDLTEQAVESQSSGNVTPDHPARRYGGIPSGGFALPGIAALRPVQQEQEESQDLNEDTTSRETVEETETEIPVALEQDEGESIPPPLPAGRPLSMPPRRSVPVPVPESETTEEEAVESVPEHAEEFVAEPEQHEEEEEAEMPPPPPPARPIGGHQDSVPPPPSMSSVPSSPPTRAIPTPSKRESTLSLGRSTTRSSHRSSNVPPNAASMGFASPRQSLDLAFDSERVQGGGLSQGGGQFLAKDIDLDTQTGNAWWRLENGVPRSLQGRNDVAFEYLSDSPGNKELEVIYEDYSRTVVSVTFDPEDTTETTTSISQNHFAPPNKPSLDVLLHYSASLGAQIFAAAHLKANDKNARGLTDKQFVDFCFSRATEPVPPIGSTFGAKVYEASISLKNKPAYATDDEPRVGDVVVFRDVKLKQTLGSKTVGSHVAIVSGFDEKKSKLRVLEVDKNGASIDEGSYKLDDLKQGTITVYRVMGKDFL